MASKIGLSYEEIDVVNTFNDFPHNIHVFDTREEAIAWLNLQASVHGCESIEKLLEKREIFFYEFKEVEIFIKEAK